MTERIAIEVPDVFALKTTFKDANLAEMPTIGRVGADSLSGQQACIGKFNKNGVEFDFFFQNHSSNRLFVLFSGYANRKKMEPPIFHRWKWRSFFPGKCLYISDPGLLVSKKIGNAWYVGNPEKDYTELLCQFVTDVAREFSIDTSDIIFYGSSGGGFASLRASCFVAGSSSIAINPQVRIPGHENKTVENLKDYMFGELSNPDFDDLKRLDLRSYESIGLHGKVVYVQNTLDLYHFNHHYSLFKARFVDDNSRDIKFIHFKDEGGHAAGEPKEMFPEIVTSVMQRK